MRALNVEELKKVNGGAAHYHWTCSPCKYVSVAIGSFIITFFLIVRQSDVRCCERTAVSHRILLD